MNKKINAFLLTLSVVITFTGCQLAREDGEAETVQDRLIGVYLSYDYIDLFDFEGYLNDHLPVSGSELMIDAESKEYEGRMYATRTDEMQTTSQGEKHTQSKFVFEQVKGIGMFSPTLTDPYNTEVTYTALDSAEGFADIKMQIKDSDNEEVLELEGTVYIVSGNMNDAIYINPVYQSAEGRVYLLSGQGFSVRGDNAEGGVYTQTLNDQVTVTENGKSESYRSNVKISVATMNPTEKVTILQLDKNSNILQKKDYMPDDVPQELVPENATDYIIVESTKTTYDKQTQIERTIFSNNESALWFFCKGDNGILRKTYTAILWDSPS